MDRTGKNYRLKPSFSDSIDKDINELEKKARMIKKLQSIMNTIKANGLYSEKELQHDLSQMEKLNAPEEEIRLICECWNIRRMANEQLMRDTKRLLERIKGELDDEKKLKEKSNKDRVSHGQKRKMVQKRGVHP